MGNPEVCPRWPARSVAREDLAMRNLELKKEGHRRGGVSEVARALRRAGGSGHEESGTQERGTSRRKTQMTGMDAEGRFCRHKKAGLEMIEVPRQTRYISDKEMAGDS